MITIALHIFMRKKIQTNREKVTDEFVANQSNAKTINFLYS